MEKIIDELFGELVWSEYFWEGESNIDLFNDVEEVRLRIDIYEEDNKEKVIENLQRKAYISFLNQLDTIREDSKEKLIEFWNERDFGEGGLEDVKPIKCFSQIENYLGSPTISIPSSDISEGVIYIFMDIIDDEDGAHGIGIEIENGKVTDIGIQADFM